jgi:sporulation protein YlmC with PRC-barrel domain
MHKLALAILVAAALAVPALAQKKDEPKAEAAKKGGIPRETFFKGQTASQYLAKGRLLGAKVADKDGQTVGAIDDLIVSQGGQIEGVIMGVGQKQVGVRIGALKITNTAGKITLTLPTATKEQLGTLEYTKIASQYLARQQLVGAKVASKDGQTIGTIDDLIVSQGGRIDGVTMGVGGFLGVGEKKIGVRLKALRVSGAEGKATVTFPAATKEMLSAVDAYQYPTSSAKKR